MAQARQMSLGVFLRAHGHHLAAWRMPGVPPEGGHSLAHFAQITQRAERACLDFVFFADSSGVRAAVQPDEALRRTGHATLFEPLTLLSALAPLTQHIGLVATASATYYEPFQVARLFASLDHLSGGRAAWNVVTSNGVGETANFSNRGHPDREQRYARAEEFVDVVRGLWDSWEDDAFVWDVANGIVCDTTRMHPPRHEGPHFSVAGPLNVARPPQGHPVVFQAGGSPRGVALAARTADAVFALHTDLADAQRFYADLKAQVAQAGRAPDAVRVMPGLFPVVARSRAEAHERYAQMQEALDPVLALSQVSQLLDGFDLLSYPPEGPVPDLPGNNASLTRLRVLRETAEREGFNLLQLARHIAGSRGHHQVIGTAADVADAMQAWFEGGAADGFNILPATLPGGLDDFTDLVVPELQRRGLFRTAYTGRTLREHLGLARPAHPATQARGA